MRRLANIEAGSSAASRIRARCRLPLLAIPIFMFFLIGGSTATGIAFAQSSDEVILAQTGAGDGFEAGPASPVLIVNVDRIYRESAAGRAIAEAEARLVREAEQELSARRDDLSALEQELADRRDRLSPAELQERTEAFRASVGELRELRRTRGVQIQKSVAAARAALKQALQPILIDLMREWRAAVMLDARNVVLSASALDITDEAIKRLDAQAPTIEVRIDTSED